MCPFSHYFRLENCILQMRSLQQTSHIRPLDHQPTHIRPQFLQRTAQAKSFLCLTNWALRREDVWESGYVDPRILDHDTCWRWLVSFKPRPLTPCAYSLGGWVGPRTDLDDVESRKIISLPGIELRPLGIPAHSQSLYRLHNPGTFCRKFFKFWIVN
jgi:hypothetical protein